MRQSATDPPAGFQTVKLSRGGHSSPEHGVCVMELASMLAGEPFSDHPQSVCPVIGSFLRLRGWALGLGRKRAARRAAIRFGSGERGPSDRALDVRNT